MLRKDPVLHLPNLLKRERAEVELVRPAHLQLLLRLPIDPRDQCVRRPPVALPGAGEEALDDLLGVLLQAVVQTVLERYEARQITSGEVIERLIELAKKVRDARHRHEALSLSVEEVAFYDALAGGSEDWTADPRLAEVAQALVRGIKEDLSVDWADHEATEAAIRVKIKRLLRRYKFEAPKGGAHGVDRVVDLLLDQARELYRFWPDVPVAELPI
jgi:Type I restriction enzyme HindI endonuclease subunit-like, C-terminal